MSSDLKAAADAIGAHFIEYRNRAERKGDTYVSGYLDGLADAEDIVLRMIQKKDQ